MATLDQLWEELLTAGLVGTDRRPYAPPPDGPVRLLTSLYCDEPAHAWLAAAGALAVLRLAGGTPARLPFADVEPSLADDWPRCRPAAARHLAQMLAGQFDECLPEWLATAAATGQRVPEEQLPELLDWAYMRNDLKPHLVAVIGARGRWLARQNGRWAYAAPPATALGGSDDVSEAWEVAAGLERLALLKQVRATDPTEALRLVQHAWPQAKHDDRLAFVRQLAVGLSHADEPFLESVLDERSSTLRQAAARLLGRLPGSRLCQRMLQRTRSLLRLEGGPRGTRKRSAAAGPSMRLAVSLPETCDAAMQRDGLTPIAVAGQAAQARWLSQMMAAVPPAEWSRLLGLSPTELAGLARANILDFALIQGWATAAAGFGDAEWAEALLRERLPELDTAALEPLLRTLPPRRREALVAGALKDIERLAQRQPAVRLLQAYAEPWSPRLTRLFVDKLREEVGRRDVPFGPPVEFGWLASLALYWDHDVFVDAAPTLRQAGQAARQPGSWINWIPTLERALDLWQFRHDLHEELAR